MRNVRTAAPPAAALWTRPCGLTFDPRGSVSSTIDPTTSSVSASLGRDHLDLIGHGPQMHRAVIEFHLARGIDPHQRVLHPVDVIAIGKVLTRVGAAAFGTVH